MRFCCEEDKKQNDEDKKEVFNFIISDYEQLYFNETQLKRLSQSLVEIGELNNNQLNFLKENLKYNLLVIYSLNYEYEEIKDILFKMK